MNIKFCTQCKVYKPKTDFYNSHSLPDGKQIRCKECSKKNNRKFHQQNPNYYWGKDGYFTKRYDETIKYVSDRNKADKSCKIYLIYVDDQIYVGGSKAHLKRIKSNLRIVYEKTQYNPLEKSSKLGVALKNYSRQNAHLLIDNLVIIKEFEGSRQDLRDEIKNTIIQLRSENKKLINKFFK